MKLKWNRDEGPFSLIKVLVSLGNKSRYILSMSRAISWVWVWGIDDNLSGCTLYELTYFTYTYDEGSSRWNEIGKYLSKVVIVDQIK